MTEIYARTFRDGWKAFTGGYYAKIITPEDGGTCYPILPDGSLVDPGPISKRQRAELESRQRLWDPIYKALKRMEELEDK